MYIEIKTDGLRGEGRIGRVETSKTGKTLYYNGRTFAKAKGQPLRANYYDKDTLEDFWISGKRKDGQDALFPGKIKIDEDVTEEYWITVRREEHRKHEVSYHSNGKSKAERATLEKGLRRRQMDNGWMPK